MNEKPICPVLGCDLPVYATWDAPWLPFCHKHNRSLHIKRTMRALDWLNRFDGALGPAERQALAEIQAAALRGDLGRPGLRRVVKPDLP